MPSLSIREQLAQAVRAGKLRLPDKKPRRKPVMTPRKAQYLLKQKTAKAKKADNPPPKIPNESGEPTVSKETWEQVKALPKAKTEPRFRDIYEIASGKADLAVSRAHSSPRPRKERSSEGGSIWPIYAPSGGKPDWKLGRKYI